MSDTNISPIHNTLTGTSAIFTKTNYLFIAILVAVTFLTLSPSLSCGFVEWDDPYYLLQNKHLKPFATCWDWNAIKSIFTTDINGNYNPLPIFTFAIEKYFFSPNPEAAPFIYHFTNLWMHVICTLLVFILFLKLGINSVGAFLGALLFGIHPMRVESVAWVTERKDVLYALFYFAAIICYLNYTTATQKRNRWYAGALILALLSCFSKIQAVSLPLSFMAIDYYNNRNWKHYKTLIIEKIPFWVLSLAFGIINLLFILKGGYFESTNPIEGYNFIGKLAIGAYSYMIYVAKWIYPYITTHYYSSPAHAPITAYISLFLVPAGVIALLIWANRKGHRYLVFGCAFFTVNVVFLLQVVPVGNAYLADRFTYVAYMGLFFITGRTYQLLTENLKKYSIVLNSAILFYCLFLAYLSYNQSGVWKDTLTLCEHNIKCHPESYYGYNQAGLYYMKQSTAADGHTVNNGKLLLQAQRSFITANTMDSLNGRPSATISSDIMQNLGVSYGLLKENDIAIHYFSKAIELTPMDVEAYKNRAYQYFLSKQLLLAIADYNFIIKATPQNSSIYYLRANCYFSKGDLINARADLDAAIAIDHTDPNYFIARSVINRAENKIADARNDALIAQKLGAEVPEIYFE